MEGRQGRPRQRSLGLDGERPQSAQGLPMTSGCWALPRAVLLTVHHGHRTGFHFTASLCPRWARMQGVFHMGWMDVPS